MKKRILSDVKIVCDPPNLYSGWCKTEAERLERLAKDYEDWVKDFQDFIRDHRSQDPVHLSVERVYKNVCSFCGSEWEWGDDEPGCCQKAIDEWFSKQAAIDAAKERRENNADL